MHTSLESEVAIGNELLTSCLSLGFPFGFWLGGIFCCGSGGSDHNSESLHVYLYGVSHDFQSRA